MSGRFEFSQHLAHGTVFTDHPRARMPTALRGQSSLFFATTAEPTPPTRLQINDENTIFVCSSGHWLKQSDTLIRPRSTPCISGSLPAPLRAVTEQRQWNRTYMPALMPINTAASGTVQSILSTLSNGTPPDWMISRRTADYRHWRPVSTPAQLARDNNVIAFLAQVARG